MFEFFPLLVERNLFYEQTGQRPIDPRGDFILDRLHLPLGCSRSEQLVLAAEDHLEPIMILQFEISVQVKIRNQPVEVFFNEL